jgi:hypothetical protein
MENNFDDTIYNSLMEDFKKFQSSQEIEKLTELVEYVRGEGILYNDFPKQNAELLELLLKISLELTDNSEIFTSSLCWFFIEEVYDIVLHQVRLSEYPSEHAILYFELTKNVLNPKFHKLYGDGNESIFSYGRCIYFILMAYSWFSEREKEFLAIYELMKPLIGDEPDHLEYPWVYI